MARISSTFSSKIIQKIQLRIIMRGVTKNLSNENKHRQSEKVICHMLNDNAHFKKANHIGIYIANQDDLDTIPLLETLVNNPDLFGNKQIYVPHIEMNAKNDKNPELCFHQLKNIFHYHDPEVRMNKIVVREGSLKADPHKLELILVPGLGFDRISTGLVNRLGRGKGYYDNFLRQIPNCHTIGLGYNEQYVPFNEMLYKMYLPFDESVDVPLKEFLSEKMI